MEFGGWQGWWEFSIPVSYRYAGYRKMVGFLSQLGESRITQRAAGRRIAENMSNDNIDKVPIWEKANLTIKEASEYSNIGINHIEE